jgi:uncharacterized protein YndB with AHSA1/START domain
MKSPQRKLVLKRILNANRARVFSALSDPAKMAEWFYGMESGRARVISDFRVGGKYRIEMSHDDQVCVPTGEYLEIVPPEKLVFSWAIDGLVTDSKVTLELLEKGTKTELVLTHELPEEVKERHQDGWINCLNHLERLLARIDEE